MSRRSLVLVLAALAVPAAAETFDVAVQRSAACITIADARYRIAAPHERADYTVRVDPVAASPDVRIQLTASIDEADFVLIGDGAAPSCRDGASSARAIKVDSSAPAPDLTIGFAPAPGAADYRIYLRGSTFAPEAVAALYAAARLSARQLAANGSN